MKLQCVAIIFLALFSCAALSEIYKQVDEHGNVTYSNVHSKDAKKVDLPPLVVVPAIEEEDAEKRIRKRIESTRLLEQREAIEKNISEETNRLEKLKKEYKGGTPDRLGSERNYQRYLDRVERLEEEISLREENLKKLKQELENLPSPSK